MEVFLHIQNTCKNDSDTRKYDKFEQFLTNIFKISKVWNSLTDFNVQFFQDISGTTENYSIRKNDLHRAH